jgi:hypothetical protein
MVSTELVTRAHDAGARIAELGVGHRPGWPDGRRAPAPGRAAGLPRAARRARGAAGGHAGGAPADLSSPARRVVRPRPAAASGDAPGAACGPRPRCWPWPPCCAWPRSAGSPPTPTTTPRCAAWAPRGAAFLSGAFEPGRRVAIDKPPVDLWLQVASTRLLGFNGVALLLPEALGGIALVAALMWLLRTLLGRAAALAGGLALAVAPSAAIVARSDTMDAVMAALAVAGARGGRAGRARRIAVAARGGRGAPRARLRGQARRGAAAGRRGGGALVVRRSARAPAARGRARAARRRRSSPRRWPGSWSSASCRCTAPVGAGRFRRLALARRAGLQRHRALLGKGGNAPGVPGGGARRGHGPHRVAWSAGVAGRRCARSPRARARGRPSRAARRRPGRCGCCPHRPISGAGSASRPWPRWRRSPSRWRSAAPAASAASGAAACSLSASGSSRALRCAASWPACARATWPASTRPSRPAWARASRWLSARVRGRQAGAGRRAVRGPRPAAGHDGRRREPRRPGVGADRGDAGGARRGPVGLPARAHRGRGRRGGGQRAVEGGAAHRSRRAPGADPLRRPGQPAGLARRSGERRGAGRVRYALLGDACTAHSGNERTGCLPVVRWARAHGIDVSRAAGQPHRGALYALSPSGSAAAAAGVRKNCHVRQVAANGAGGGSVRAPPASRGPARRGARARRASRRCSAARRSRSLLVRGTRRSAFPGSRRCAATARATASRCR